MLVNVWARAARAEVPKAIPCGYADDTGATSGEAGAIQQVLNITGRFATVTCQAFNAKKSHVWATCNSGKEDIKEMRVLSESVPSTRGGRVLGAHIAYGRHVRNDLGEKRVERGIAVADRVRWVPLAMHIRSRLLASVVLPASL